MPTTDRPAQPMPAFRDIARSLPGWQPSVIFDVGANIGQTSTRLATWFPDARIHAFEPVAASFAKLSATAEGFANLSAHQVALSCADGQARVSAIGTSTANRLLPRGGAHGDSGEAIRTSTGATMAAALGVDAVSFLKIDTEGHDLDVVLGFAPLLPAIDFVQVEAGMNPYNRTHVPFRILEDALRHFGFLLFNFYDRTLEFHRGGRPVLRRADAVFIHRRLVDLDGIA
jgi:FkbM family methyltransferase